MSKWKITTVSTTTPWSKTVKSKRELGEWLEAMGLMDENWHGMIRSVREKIEGTSEPEEFRLVCTHKIKKVKK
jgi:hypothetical protein